MAAAARREAPAESDEDWIVCGRCKTHMALGVVPIREDARIKCPRCGAWVMLRVQGAPKS